MIETQTPDLLQKLFRLDGKVAIITGGYGGIGEVVCRGLAAVGAKIAVAGRNSERAEMLVTSLKRDGCDAYAAPFDAENLSEIRRMVDDTVSYYGRLDILVNCVGLNREEKLLDVTEENFDLVYTANLKSAFFLAQSAAKHMVAQGQGGKQVHLGSVRTQLGTAWAWLCGILCRQRWVRDDVQTVGGGASPTQHQCKCGRADICSY